jgi:toxin ParE1/3/4
MPSSRRVRFTAEAEADLREILQYTRETWGERRRRDDARLLDAALWRLADFPALGRSRDEVAAGIRSHAVGQHVVLYRAGDESIVVERIIRRARDFDVD